MGAGWWHQQAGCTRRHFDVPVNGHGVRSTSHRVHTQSHTQTGACTHVSLGVTQRGS